MAVQTMHMPEFLGSGTSLAPSRLMMILTLLLIVGIGLSTALSTAPPLV